MYISHLNLQNFRSYKKAEFTFDKSLTFIVGPNTAGKSNIIETIFLLSTGKSFRAEKELQLIRFEEELARVKGAFLDTDEKHILEGIITSGFVHGVKTPYKKFLVNGVSKRRIDFSGMFKTVLFSPVDLDIIVDSPKTRRTFLDDVLEQVDTPYKRALSDYTKALRQRNALLELSRETGRRDSKQFAFWDEVLIKNGQLLTSKREEFVKAINSVEKEIFDFTMHYDTSIVSEERLAQYREAEAASGVTLVGPHRDDFWVEIPIDGTYHNAKLFGSRGQQRLIVLQLKLLQLQYTEKLLGEKPTLLLDDIFSELDDTHIHHIWDIVGSQQTIITTTHKEFIPEHLNKKFEIIELGK